MRRQRTRVPHPRRECSAASRQDWRVFNSGRFVFCDSQRVNNIVAGQNFQTRISFTVPWRRYNENNYGPVSVIIPTFNRPNLLPRSVESALRAGSDVEVIIADLNISS